MKFEQIKETVLRTAKQSKIIKEVGEIVDPKKLSDSVKKIKNNKKQSSNVIKGFLANVINTVKSNSNITTESKKKIMEKIKNINNTVNNIEKKVKSSLKGF